MKNHLIYEDMKKYSPSRRDTIITFRAPISPEKGGIQSLIIEPPQEPLENLAQYLGLDEPKIVDWLLKNISFKRLLAKKIFNDAKQFHLFSSIQEPFTRNRENPGDIDIIAFSEIDYAIAFECKAVKVICQKDGKIKINKATKLNEGARQANDYLKFGFHQVYFLIVILDDGRNYNRPNFIFNYTSINNLPMIYKGEWKDNLDEKIGVIYCSIEQTRNLDVDHNNSITMDIERIAQRYRQKDGTTLKLKKFTENIN